MNQKTWCHFKVQHIVLAAAILLAIPISLFAGTVTHVSWGKGPAGEPVELYTITLDKTELKITDYGARIVSMRVPNRDGELGNVIVGPDLLDGFLTDRYAPNGAATYNWPHTANRIAGGQFTLNGITYTIPKNNGPNALHGGPLGFNHKVWKARVVKNGVEMTLVSPDGDMGFPGTLTVHVTFALIHNHNSPELRILYNAETDQATVINLTNHAYFNLADDGVAPVLDDTARIDADNYTPFDTTNIPTGAIEPVAGTPFDFRSMRTIEQETLLRRGYDNNFVLRPHPDDKPVAEVINPKSGRTLKGLYN